MNQNKVPSTVDLDTLLEALKDGSPVIVEDSTDVVIFISQFNIQPGLKPISKKYLYKLYKGFSKDPIGQSSFTYIVNRYIESNQTHFYIDKTAFQVAPELQKIVNNKTTSSIKNSNNHKHFKYFLDKFQVKEGSYWLEGYILFSLYDCWTYQIRKEKPIKKSIFLQLCEIFFETKTINKTKYFQLDKSVMQYFSDKYLESVRSGHENYENGKKRKKTISKK